MTARHALAAATIAAACVLLTGCNEPPESADDPRDGRVTLNWRTSEIGEVLSYDWKVCAGPDLVSSIAGRDYITKNAKECEPR